MRKNNNKGFTLLELLISIFILTTVIFIGYNIINKSTTYIQNRKNIHEGQLAVNDINVYLTDDLEHAESVTISSNYLDEINTSTNNSTEENGITNDSLKVAFKEYSGDKLFDYSYNINYKKDEENIKNITYKVEIIKDRNDYKYSISRTEDNKIAIDFIKDEVLRDGEQLKADDQSKQLPFTIGLESPYEVTLGYVGKDNDEFVEHKFIVASRLYDSDGGDGSAGTGDNENNTPTPEEVPEIPSEEELPEIPSDVNKDLYQCIGYWTMDKKYYDDTYMRGDLYTWIKYGENTGESYGKQVANTDKFYISAKNGVNSGNSNNGSTEAYMKDTESSGQKLTDVILSSVPSNQVYKIKIYVSPHTKIEQTKVTFNNNGNNSTEFIGITDEITKDKLQSNNGSYTLEGGEEGKWYNVDVKIGSSHKMNFDINGMLSIDKSEVPSGYALIVYGDKADEGGSSSSGGSSSDLDGDIIFEFTRNDSLSQNSNQTRLNTIIKVKDENGNYIERHNQITGDQDINQISNNRIEIVISKSQIEFYTDSNSYPTINNNQIGKDLNNVKEVLIKIDKNVKVTSEPGDAQKISETEYKVKLRTDGQPSRFTFRFDVTAYGTNKIAFTFIEG